MSQSSSAAPEPQDTADEVRGQDGATQVGNAELERVKAEREQLFTQLQRAQADYQNLRRRAQSDLEAGLLRALEPLLQNLLLVLDNLELACNAQAASDETRNLISGVRLTRDQLLRSLELQGVGPIPDGGPFDPARHLAVVQRTGAGPAGQVVETLRRGYTWKNAVLRAAQVVVSTEAGPSAPPLVAPIQETQS